MAQIPPITDAYIDEIIKAPDAYNATLNKTQGVKLRELLKLMRDRMEQQSGGSSVDSNPLIPVDYLQLVSLITANALIPGGQYLLTDYKTYWKISLTGPSEIRESDVQEPLILSAVAVNKLSSIAKSTLYPKDIIYYSIGKLDYYGNEIPYDPADWTYFYKGIVPIKGMVFRRIDLNRKLDINFDYKGFWVENDGTHLPIESQLIDNVSILQNGIDSQYSSTPVIIPFGSLKNCKITIGFKGYYAGNADKICPVTYADLKLNVKDSEIDFFYIQDEENYGTIRPTLNIKNSKLTNLFWIANTPPTWNKVLNFSYTCDGEPYPGSSYYEVISSILPILANDNVKVSVDYNWNSPKYSILENNTSPTDTFSTPLLQKYYLPDSNL